MLAFERDLSAMAQNPYVKPLRRFLFHGVIPTGPLFALLCGHHDHTAHTDPALFVVAAFLDHNQASLDICHGHLGYVLRWQAEGGWSGRLAA